MSGAYRGISREMWLMALAMLINRSGSMVLLFMSVYLTKERHFSIAEAGVVLSLFGIGSLAGAFVGGKLVDRIGYYPILIWSLLLSGAMILVLGQMRSLPLIGLFTFLVTATGDMFRPANSASIAFYSTKEGYTQSIALNRLAMNLGFTVGPMLGGLLASHSYALLFWADGITCMLAALFIRLAIPRKEGQKAEQEHKNAAMRSPYRDGPYLVFLFLCMLYALCFFQMLTALPLYYKNVYHFTEKPIGWLMAMNGLGVAVIEMFLIHSLRNRPGAFRFMALGSALLVLGYLVLPPFHGWWALILSMVMITFSEMFAMPFMGTFSMKRAAIQTMGEYMALYSMSWSVALIAAPLLGSQLITRWGYDGLWYTVSALGLLTLGGFALLGRRLRAMHI